MDKLTYTDHTYLDDLHATGFGIPITSIFRLEFYIYTCPGKVRKNLGLTIYTVKLNCLITRGL